MSYPAEPEGRLGQAEAQVERKAQPTTTDDRFPLADAGPYYDGLWCGIPNYKCPYCMFATLDGTGAVEIHILELIDQGSERHQAALEVVKGDNA